MTSRASSSTKPNTKSLAKTDSKSSTKLTASVGKQQNRINKMNKKVKVKSNR